jgi:hypothetical protein
MSYGFKILAAVATMLCSSTVSAVPITIGFTAEVGRRINGPFDGPIQLGTLIEGWWTYDSNALPVTLDHDCCQNGITYVSEGPAYGVTIKADGLPAFTLPGTRINITNDLVISDGMMGNACGRGEFERTVDRYHVGIPNRSFEPFNWTMYNCSARAFESEALPTYAPPLGDGLV